MEGFSVPCHVKIFKILNDDIHYDRENILSSVRSLGYLTVHMMTTLNAFSFVSKINISFTNPSMNHVDIKTMIKYSFAAD